MDQGKHETVREILRKEGVSWQATKTWKASKDPDFVAKKTRILDLYDRPPADGRGDLCRRVRAAEPANPSRSRLVPSRQRATHTRTNGVRHTFAALDLATGQMFYRFATANAGHSSSASASNCAAASLPGALSGL
jgi:hypothetical protein